MNRKAALAVFVLVFAGAIAANTIATNPKGNDGTNTTTVEKGLKKFNSPEEVRAFLEKNIESRSRGYGGVVMEMAGAGPGLSDSIAAFAQKSQSEAMPTSTFLPAPDEGAGEYSTTNIQVAGVDEADMVKNDGKYIYVLSRGTVSIVAAYPPEDADILSTITVDGNPRDLYLNKDRLVILGEEYAYRGYPEKMAVDGAPSPEVVEPYPTFDGPMTAVYVYDISDRTLPEQVSTVRVRGSYFNSRMIGGYVYLLTSQPARYYEDEILMPEIISTTSETEKSIEPDVYYFDEPDYGYNYLTVASIDVMGKNPDIRGKSYLLGFANNIYVSQENIYVTYQRWVPEPYILNRVLESALKPLLPKGLSDQVGSIQDSDKDPAEKELGLRSLLRDYLDDLSRVERAEFEKGLEKRMASIDRELAKERERTAIHKLAIDEGDVTYVASGSVPGRVLNQFSMDEYKGFFRIATTTGQISRRSVQMSGNNIYVLDGDLEIVGWLEDLAPGERIYSARFMGERAYLVTFKKVDPLFVVDLSNPEEPEVLGKLKIPGYSDYLHPYDKDHIIGIGKDTREAREGDFAWYQGLKIALFDVSDVDRPREISKIIIGDRGTDSYALRDHRAFTFDREKNLLVIPVLLAELDYEKIRGYPDERPEWAYGKYVWQGAYVLRVDTEDGIRIQGRVSHDSDPVDSYRRGGLYQGSEYSVKRSLYMDNVLYTVSDGLIKMNDLEDLDYINKVRLPTGDRDYPMYLE